MCLDMIPHMVGGGISRRANDAPARGQRVESGWCAWRCADAQVDGAFPGGPTAHLSGTCRRRRLGCLDVRACRAKNSISRRANGAHLKLLVALRQHILGLRLQWVRCGGETSYRGAGCVSEPRRAAVLGPGGGSVLPAAACPFEKFGP